MEKVKTVTAKCDKGLGTILDTALRWVLEAYEHSGTKDGDGELQDAINFAKAVLGNTQESQ